MSNQRRSGFWLAVLGLAGLAGVLLLADLAPAEVAGSSEVAVPLLFDEQIHCTPSGAQTASRAIELERTARARWERVPYALSDGAHAVSQLLEAVSCFRAAGDREGRARAERDLTLWQRELDRLYARARLNLTLALRHQDVEASATEAQQLLALLAKAGPAADAYRAFLAGVERSSRAARLEQLRAREEE